MSGNYNTSLSIPKKWEKIIHQDEDYEVLYKNTLKKFKSILNDKLYFFPEYTDHGVVHFENTIKIAHRLINQNSYTKDTGMDAKNITCILLSLLLHDIGMHIDYEGFKTLMSNSSYPSHTEYRNKSWKALWDEYLSEAKHWNNQKKEQIFGRINVTIRDLPSIKGNITDADQMLCGEFLRGNHHILAYDIATIGFPCADCKVEPFIDNEDVCFSDLPNTIGLIGYSHGIPLWNAVGDIENLTSTQRKSFNGIKIPFLMIVLRLSDLFDISDVRTDKMLLNFKKLYSPRSYNEWVKHSYVKDIDIDNQDDPELIYVNIELPSKSSIYLDLRNLIEYIQNELDVCWAVLGWIYGKASTKLGLSIRRIRSSLDDPKLTEKCNYVVEPIHLKMNRSTLDLLVGPLYRYEQSYGIRELIQNAVDACIEKAHTAPHNYKPSVKIKIIEKSDGSGTLTIDDNGVGMGENVIKNQYLTVGSSYRDSKEWTKEYKRNEVSEIARIGRFGVGVLSGFLLGDEIEVTTSARYENYEYSFCVSRSMSQIEVHKEKKSKNRASGTRIKINMIQGIMQKLKDECTDERIGNNNIYWCNWYYGENPKVTIAVPTDWKYKEHGYSLSINDEPTGIPWHSFETDEFSKIEWFFSNDINDMFFHNGMYMKYRGLSRKFLWSINDPVISVVDKDNKILFDLVRENVSGYLPFEKDLVIDIYKDLIVRALIARFQTSECSENEIIINNFLVSHDAIDPSIGIDIATQYVFSRHGYYMAHRYTLEKSRVNKIIIINVKNNFDRSRKLDVDAFHDKRIIFLNVKKFETKVLRGTGFTLHRKYTYFPNYEDKTCGEKDAFIFCDCWEDVGGESNSGMFKENKKQCSMWKGIESISVWECKIDVATSQEYELTVLEDLLRDYFAENIIIQYQKTTKEKEHKSLYARLDSYIKWLLEYEKVAGHLVYSTDYDEDNDWIEDVFDSDDSNSRWLDDSTRNWFEY